MLFLELDDITSNVVQNYLLSQKLPNSFNNTLNHFEKYNNCVLVLLEIQI